MDYIENIQEDLFLDDDEVQEFILENFGEDFHPLDPKTYCFYFENSKQICIFTKFWYEENNSLNQYSLFPVLEIACELELEEESLSLYSWNEEYSEDQVRDILLDLGLEEINKL